MAEFEKGESISLEELVVSTLAMTDAVAKLLIEIREAAIDKVSSYLKATQTVQYDSVAVGKRITVKGTESISKKT